MLTVSDKVRVSQSALDPQIRTRRLLMLTLQPFTHMACCDIREPVMESRHLFRDRDICQDSGVKA